MAENPELDDFVDEKLIYDKDGSLIQRKMNGLFIKCAGRLIINLKKSGNRHPTLSLIQNKELPDVLKT